MDEHELDFVTEGSTPQLPSQQFLQAPAPIQGVAESAMAPQLEYEPAFGDEDDEASGSGSTSLGVTLLASGVGAGIGYAYGGLVGAIAGTLYGGAAINAVRAARNVSTGDETSDREALISGTYALVGAGVASYLLYKAMKKSPPDKDERLVGVK